MTTNTHYAVVTGSVPPSMTVVAHGPERFCRESLTAWLAAHPLGEFEEGEILAKDAEVTRLRALCVPLTDLAQELDLARQNLHHARAMSAAHFARAEKAEKLLAAVREGVES